jgi:ABC-type multidrug transport system fused ATPase/permease subunit
MYTQSTRQPDVSKKTDFFDTIRDFRAKIGRMAKQTTLLQSIWSKNWSSIVLVYLLNITESICSLLIPSSVGLLINSIIHHTAIGFVAFAVAYIGWQGLAMVRKIMDTWIFSGIYNEICLDTIEQHTEVMEANETSKLNARIELLKQVVAFFETDFPFMVTSVVSIVGSAWLLYFYNASLLLVCLLVIVPSLWVNYWFGRRLQAITAHVNDEYEKQLDVLARRNSMELRSYFANVRKLNIRRSNMQAYNFGTLEIFVFAMIFMSVVIICSTPAMSYGDIVASYGIVLRFAYGFDFIPHLTERWASMRDIDSRLEATQSEISK